MQIKLIKDLVLNGECISSETVFEGQIIKPNSTTVEFTTEAGNVVRVFHYEYTEA